MTPIERINAGPRASQIIIAGDRFETSGMVALKPESDTDITAQTQCVLRQLEAMLARIGVGKERVTRVQIWLSDMADFDAMNLIYDAWAAEAPPTRACVGAQLVTPQYLIEIQASGYL
ncbi:RidA family protein [Pseudomonas sp. 21LCFQ010]|uniref:RidA family protein n=1 Tax=unclassified Pseudomonas TaxID=196821 RepID=UPI0004F74B0C|nr:MULTISPECIES: RidA family protein [unclassified Pseudomonas]MCO8165463.1 RidA family protein [Pseudomonas sp. 21LCFQ010]BAP41616.1 endoribonuclease L-PSP family protein [Pseudomonas sp. StFLB209]